MSDAIDVSHLVDEGQEPLCPLCDQPILFNGVPAVAHGSLFMICDDCAEEVNDD